MFPFLNTLNKKNQKEIKKASLIMMCGVPGSGKSSIAQKIARELNLEVCSSDEIRKKAFNSDRYTDAGDISVMSIRNKYYAMLSEKVEGLLKDGKKVVIDASNMDDRRIVLIDKFGELIGKDKIVLVVIRTNKDKIAKRMEEINKMANDNEDFVTGWQRVYGYFEKHLKSGKFFWPTIAEGVTIIKVKND